MQYVIIVVIVIAIIYWVIVGIAALIGAIFSAIAGAINAYIDNFDCVTALACGLAAAAVGGVVGALFSLACRKYRKKAEELGPLPLTVYWMCSARLRQRFQP